jgi:DNA mismatch repair ATPase MutS
MFDRKKKIKEKLSESFGKLKDDPFYFELIERYFRKKDNSDAFQVLSDKTCNDLDFQELFMFVDRTTSKVGQQFLYYILRTIPSNRDKFSQQEKIIETISKDENLRLNLQLHLEKLNKTDAFNITTLFQNEHIKEPKWFFIIRLLSFTSLLSLLMLTFNPALIYVFTAVFIVNFGIHYWNKRNLYDYLSTIPQLLKLNRVAKEFYNYEILKSINPDLSESIKIIDKVKNRMSFFNLETKFQGDLEAIFWGFMEVFKILFLIEPLLLFGVLGKLDKKRKEIEELFIFVGEVDMLISIASLRKGLNNYCIPTILSEPKKLIAKNVYHPLIRDCVKNTIHVDNKSILLTGSNMSGKTSFIRTIGINVITGLSLNTCFAEQFSMTGMKIYSAIRISDDLMNDKSYYFEEVLTIKEMIDKSGNGQPNLFLLDEIFKGTNTIERISAGKAVLSGLVKYGNIVFVSTHDIELADLLKDEFELYHFSEKVNNKTVDFDYELKSGKLKNRNAIKILQINHYPDEIIQEAVELSKELDKITLADK